MTENEYIIATNRVKISLALTVLRDVLPGGEYGITDDELGEIMDALREQEQGLFKLIEINT